MKTIKSLFILSIVTTILILSLLGTPAINSQVVPVGGLQFGAFENGLSLHQLYKRSYYTFSPFNDYVLDRESKIALISAGEAASIESNPLTAISYSLEKLAGSYKPAISFEGKNKVTYESSIINNDLVVTRSVALKGASGKKTLGTTLSFDMNDIVFDKSGNLYNIVDPELLDTFTKMSGINLLPNTYDSQITLSEKTIYIASNDIATVIAITASGNQTLKVDWNARTIAIEEEVAPKNGVYKTSVNVKVFKNVGEAYGI